MLRKRWPLTLLFLCACGSGLQVPDSAPEQIRFYASGVERACKVAEALELDLAEHDRAVCSVMLHALPAVVEALAPSGTGPDAGAATPAGLGGADSNGVRSVGGSAGQ